MQHGSDASVEEILESIKKVIARDNRSGAHDRRRRRERESLEAEIADEPETTEAEPENAAAPEPASHDEAEEILDLSPADYAEDAAFDDEDMADEPRDLADDDTVSLLTQHTHDAMRQNLAALATMATPGAAPQIVRSGETSLEGLVREMLRPMLAQWLDTNLPPMVEKLVQAEIARIAGKRG
ncbi:hypothetical protein HME9302_02388 [Alteripontixanthobacter maritimus]|uniref:DUF2497 domain-containing protein n=1 Tax=Alteripontixanthobacter maritimus TaxID=2161824 RepID=A0A369QE28_9SPHN|nr:DUF2497 domain-containing protein [Alteripontixanthobacter maritimus]RDC61169.1 hypothetical protein HME9302_02388 [Alteripontixanthobacter maritimus]